LPALKHLVVAMVAISLDNLQDQQLEACHHLSGIVVRARPALPGDWRTVLWRRFFIEYAPTAVLGIERAFVGQQRHQDACMSSSRRAAVPPSDGATLVPGAILPWPSWKS
jgi:hypothetical protein